MRVVDGANLSPATTLSRSVPLWRSLIEAIVLAAIGVALGVYGLQFIDGGGGSTGTHLSGRFGLATGLLFCVTACLVLGVSVRNAVLRGAAGSRGVRPQLESAEPEGEQHHRGADTGTAEATEVAGVSRVLGVPGATGTVGVAGARTASHASGASNASGVSNAADAPDLRILRGDDWLRLRSLPSVCTDLLLLTLVVTAFAYAWSRYLGVMVVAVIVGVWIGYGIHRGRKRSVPVHRVLSIGWPLVAAAYFVGMAYFMGAPYLGFVLLPASGIGVGIGMAVDDVLGPKRRVLARAWRGVSKVGGARIEEREDRISFLPDAPPAGQTGSGTDNDRAIAQAGANPSLNASRSASASCNTSAQVSPRPDAVTFAVGALSRHIGKRQARAFMRSFVQQFPLAKKSDVAGRRIVMMVGFAAFIVGMLAFLTGIVEIASEAADDAAAQLLGMSAVILLFLLAGAVFSWFLVRTRNRVPTGEDYLRLTRFAKDNGLVFDPGPAAVSSGEIETNLMLREARPRLRISNRELRESSNRAGSTNFSGNCTVELSTELPHIVLIAQGFVSPSFSAFEAPAGNQRLSLEGDFDKHFALYVPRGYERDALYLFTPDVMVRLIDEVRGFDVELIDNFMVLRSRHDLVTVDPAVWSGLADALTALTDKISRWERWRDERLLLDGRVVDHDAVPAFEPAAPLVEVAGRVASPGKRLRRGIGPGAKFAIGFIALYLTLTGVANLL